MRSHALVLVAALSSTLLTTITAQDLDTSDIPSQCTPVCSSLLTATLDCERANNNESDGPGYINCLCSGTNAEPVIRLCEACVYEAHLANGESASDARDDDVNDILKSCSFSTTTYNLASATTASPMTANTRAVSSSATGAVGSASASLTAATGSAATATGSLATSLSSRASGLSSALASATSAAATGNGAVRKAGGAVLAGGMAILAAGI